MLKNTELHLFTIPNIPEVRPADDIAAMILQALKKADMTLQTGDVLVIAQKIVSKAEGRLVNLESVEPGPQALAVAEETGKDPRLVELVLAESEEIARKVPGILLTRHHKGIVSANSGIDRSNVAQEEDGTTVLLLPVDSDQSALRIHESIQAATGLRLGVIVSDTLGRPFRMGTVGVAVGVAGMLALWSRRGEQDRYGYELKATSVGLADEIATAAGILMGQGAEGLPVVIVRGLSLPDGEGTSADLTRPKESLLFT